MRTFLTAKRVNLETSNLVHWFVIASPTLPMKNLPWKGRRQGQVTWLEFYTHWRRQGGRQKNNFLVKIEGLSPFTWSVFKSSDISTGLRLTRLTFDFEHHLLLLLSSATWLQLQSLCCTMSFLSIGVHYLFYILARAFTVSRAFNDPQQLSLAPGLPPAKSCRACYDNPTGRGYFYQMSKMYTCIAYLIEIRKFCSKNVVHKSVNFEAQNALKLTYEHL